MTLPDGPLEQRLKRPQACRTCRTCRACRAARRCSWQGRPLCDTTGVLLSSLSRRAGTGVREQKTLLWKRRPLGVSARKTPNQGAESSFRRWTPRQRRAENELLFRDICTVSPQTKNPQTKNPQSKNL